MVLQGKKIQTKSLISLGGTVEIKPKKADDNESTSGNEGMVNQASQRQEMARSAF